jgi:hypothetical protein
MQKFFLGHLESDTEISPCFLKRSRMSAQGSQRNFKHRLIRLRKRILIVKILVNSSTEPTDLAKALCCRDKKLVRLNQSGQHSLGLARLLRPPPRMLAFRKKITSQNGEKLS